MRRFLSGVFRHRADSAMVRAALITGLCFIVGAVCGCALAAYGGETDSLVREAGGYTSIVKASGLQVAVDVLKYPLIVFLCGLSAAGVLLIPAAMGVRGFFLAFSVTTFVRLYGGMGLVFSLSVFGVQCFLVFPLLMLLSAQGLISAISLMSMASGGGKKLSGPVFGREYFTRSLVILVLLGLCILTEYALTPAVAGFVAGFI